MSKHVAHDDAWPGGSEYIKGDLEVGGSIYNQGLPVRGAIEGAVRYAGTPYTVPGGTDWHTLAFDTIDLDPAGLATAPYSIQLPVTGWYYLYCHSAVTVDAAGQWALNLARDVSSPTTGGVVPPENIADLWLSAWPGLTGDTTDGMRSAQEGHYLQAGTYSLVIQHLTGESLEIDSLAFGWAKLG